MANATTHELSDLVYTQVNGLDILAAAWNHGYLVWHQGDLVWRAGKLARATDGTGWQLITAEGDVYDVVASGLQLAKAMFGFAIELWDTMALATGNKIMAVALSIAALDYVWADKDVALVVYPDGNDLHGPYTRHSRDGWYSISPGV